MCHACKDILEIMNIQGDAIVTDQLERDSTCKVVFFISVHVEVTHFHSHGISCTSVTWFEYVSICMAFSFCVFSLWSTKEKLALKYHGGIFRASQPSSSVSTLIAEC